MNHQVSPFDERPPNLALRRARLRLASPLMPSRRMSRQELAEAVNAHIFNTTGRRVQLDASYIGKLERGTHRWPRAECRQGLRAVLGATANVEIGFYSVRRNASDEAFLAADPALTGERRTLATAATQLGSL